MRGRIAGRGEMRAEGDGADTSRARSNEAPGTRERALAVKIRDLDYE
jgi:hypothetical protein